MPVGLDAYSAIPQNFGAVGDGVTDDTLSVQAALNSGTPTLYVPSTYAIGPVTVPTSVKKIVGPGTFKATGTIANYANLMAITDRNNNKLRIAEITFTANHLTYPTVAVVQFGNSTVDIDGVNFSDCGRFAVLMSGSSIGSSLRNCQIWGFAQSAIDATAPNVLWIERNTITSGGNSHHTVNINTGTDVTLRGNSIYGGMSGCFSTYLFNVVRGQVNGDYRNSPGEAVVIDSCTDVSIEAGTKMYWDPGVSQDFAISLGGQNGTNLMQKNVAIRGVTIRGCGKSGIFVGANSKGTLIDGCSVIDANALGAGNPTPAYADGVTLGGLGGESTITRTRINNLTVTNDAATNMKCGVHEQAGPGGTPDYTSVVHINAVGMVTGATSLIGPHSTSV